MLHNSEFYHFLEDTELFSYVSYEGIKSHRQIEAPFRFFTTTRKQIRRDRRKVTNGKTLSPFFVRGMHLHTLEQVEPLDVKYAVHENAASLLHESLKAMRSFRQPRRGLLPFGIKLHMPKDAHTRSRFYLTLPGVYTTPFGIQNKRQTVNLPPLTNVGALASFDSYQKEKGYGSIFEDEDITLQICLPFVAKEEQARILLLSLLFGSDNAKQWDHTQFYTTHHEQTSRRMLVYGAGVLDEDFPFLGKDVDTSHPVILGALPSDADTRRRTDVLGMRTLRDVEVAQFVGTLLAHEKYGGVYADLAESFTKNFEELLTYFIEQERDSTTGEDTTGLERTNSIDFVFNNKKHSDDRERRDQEHSTAMLRLAHLASDERTLLIGGKGEGRINLVKSMQALIRYYEGDLRRRYYSEEFAQLREELGDKTYEA